MYYKIILSFSFVFMFPHKISADNSSCQAPEKIYLVRHAKKVGADGQGLLIPEGWNQVTAIASYFKGKQLSHLYTSEIRRARETASPFINRPSIIKSEIGREKQKIQAAVLCSHNSQDRVLVVGHSDSIPHLLEHVGVTYDESIEYCMVYELDLINNKISSVTKVPHCV